MFVLMSKPAQKFENIVAIFKQNYSQNSFLLLKRPLLAVSDFLDFHQKCFLTSTTEKYVSG